MKHEVGYSYNCRNCKCVLSTEIYFYKNLFPINFGHLIGTCPECETKYVIIENDEFFSIKNYTFFIRLIRSLLVWAILIMPVMAVFIFSEKIIILTYIILALLYITMFTIKWKKAIEKSKKRLNDKNYIIDLLLAKLLTLNDINVFYKEGIISENIYNDTLKIYNKT